MGAPITWRNVESANPGLAARPMEAAAGSVNSAFDIFNKVIQQRQGIDNANVAAVEEGGKQAYLDRLQMAKTPEEVAALEASGELNTLAQGLSATTRAQLRGAAEARLTSTRQGAVAANAYGDQALGREQLPVREQIAALTSQGKFAEARTLASNTPNLQGLGVLMNGITTAERTFKTQGQADIASANRAKLDALNLTKAEREAAEAQLVAAETQETRRLADRIAAEAVKNTARVTALAQEQGKAAKALGLPVTQQGAPDFVNWSKDQLVTFDTFAKNLGTAGPSMTFPGVGGAVVSPSTAGINGDTARGSGLYSDLSKSGEFSPRVLAANEARIRSAYNSTAPGAVGNDAVAIAAADARNQVGFARDDANNWYAPGSADARRSYEDLAKVIPDLVKGSSNGLDAGEDVEDVQRLLGEVATAGIKRRDGTTVVPSANDFMRFVRSSEGGWFSDDKRAKNIRKDLEKWVNSPEGIAMATKGAKSESYQDRRKMEQTLRDTLNPPKK